MLKPYLHALTMEEWGALTNSVSHYLNTPLPPLPPSWQAVACVLLMAHWSLVNEAGSCQLVLCWVTSVPKLFIKPRNLHLQELSEHALTASLCVRIKIF